MNTPFPLYAQLDAIDCGPYSASAKMLLVIFIQISYHFNQNPNVL